MEDEDDEDDEEVGTKDDEGVASSVEVSIGATPLSAAGVASVVEVTGASLELEEAALLLLLLVLLLFDALTSGCERGLSSSPWAMPANTPSVAVLDNGTRGIERLCDEDDVNVESVEADDDDDEEAELELDEDELDEASDAPATFGGGSSVIAESSFVSSESCPPSGFSESFSAEEDSPSSLSFSLLSSPSSSTASSFGGNRPLAASAIECIFVGSGSGSPSWRKTVSIFEWVSKNHDGWRRSVPTRSEWHAMKMTLRTMQRTKRKI